MGIKIVFLILLYLFFGVKPVAAISFAISNPQQSENEVTIDVSLSGLTSSSCLNGSCYLQAAFTSPTPIKYFGSTKNNNDQWYEYISSPTQSYMQSTFFTFQPVSGTWSGQLTLKINAESPNYKGPGAYNIKAWRYSGNSNSYAGDPATLAVNVVGPTPTPTPTPSPSPTPKPSPTPTPLSSSSASKTKTTNPTLSPTPKPSLTTPSSTPQVQLSLSKSTSQPKLNYQIASIAGASSSASPSSKIEIKNQKQINPAIWIGSILIFAGSSCLGYIYWKKR